jgi:hypothetical protein
MDLPIVPEISFFSVKSSILIIVSLHFNLTFSPRFICEYIFPKGSQGILPLISENKKKINKNKKHFTFLMTELSDVVCFPYCDTVCDIKSDWKSVCEHKERLLLSFTKALPWGLKAFMPFLFRFFSCIVFLFSYFFLPFFFILVSVYNLDILIHGSMWAILSLIKIAAVSFPQSMMKTHPQRIMQLLNLNEILLSLFHISACMKYKTAINLKLWHRFRCYSCLHK